MELEIDRKVVEEGEEKGGERRGPRYIHCVGSSAGKIIREAGGDRGRGKFCHVVLVRAVPFQHKRETFFSFGLVQSPDGQEQPLPLTLCKLIPSVK